MQLKNVYIFISFASLLLLMGFQIHTIQKSAETKEELFNEKVNLIITQTTEALLKDQETCRRIKSGISKNEIHTIDSLLKHYMRFYNFNLSYEFEMIPNATTNLHLIKLSPSPFPPDEPGCYSKNLDEVANLNGMRLKLNIPGKEEHLKAEMGPLFVTSVALILLMGFLSIKTFISLRKERAIADSTINSFNHVAHELKTPISNIALAGKLLLKEQNLTIKEKVKHYAEIIAEENEKLKFQIDQALSVDAIKNNEPNLRAQLNVQQILDDALKLLDLTIENNKVEINKHYTPEPLYIAGNRLQLINAFKNLIDNAIKYSHGNATIDIYAQHTSKNIEITIADKGIGIAKKNHKKIFKKYFRVSSGDLHSVKGSGIGLAYVKEVIASHNGNISLESELEKGSTFTLCFPDGQ